MESVDALDFLLGNWSISRSLHDHQSDISGSFVGSAVFTELETSGFVRRAGYEESGKLQFGTHTGDARRRLVFVGQGGTGVEVVFADGSPFVDLDLRTGTWQGIHPCRDDSHEIVFAVASRNEIREFWRVRGPQNDYEASAILKRLS
jgi:Family of unknown function (DUF6314)